MIKRMLPLILILLCAFAAARAETTLLVYMCGASMPDAACLDICEMALAETGKNVNIAVLAGGAGDSEWAFDEIGRNTRTLLTLRDGDFEKVEDWGFKSMGSGESLLEFLEYGLKNYPADRTIVVLWDHGAGSEGGMCFDYGTEEQDGLTLTEINDVFYDLQESVGDFHIDVFGCDACLMATYELATLLSYYDIDYFIASEDSEPGVGWSYTSWLKALEADPDMAGDALCRAILDSYMKDALAEDPNEVLTMSAIDLRGIEALQDSMEAFAGTLTVQVEGDGFSDLRRGRSRMYTFGSYGNVSWDMVDMGEMLDNYARFDPDAAAKARAALEKAVLYKRQTDNLGTCSGLSVLIPQDTRNEFETYSKGFDISFYIPNWVGFVKAYSARMAGGSASLGAATPHQITGDGFFAQLAGLLSGEEETTPQPAVETSQGSGGLVEQLANLLGQSGVSVWDPDTQTYGGEAQPANSAIAQIAGQIAAGHSGAGDYAFSAKVDDATLKYLDYVEGMLMMDVTDGDVAGYIDLGLMRNNLVNWNTGEIYSLFDGRCPVFGDQIVPVYDQLSNERGRRGLIPIKLNGEATYLIVEFPADGGDGSVIGTNAGYDDGGLPIRETTRLRPGDQIIPVYTLYVDTGAEEYEEREFDGDPVTWQEGMTVEMVSSDGDDDGEPIKMMFCFVLNDVFGKYDMTDIIEFEM